MEVSRMNNRTVWVDCCKGMCIILVVYGHIAGGLEASRILAPNSFWIKMRDWVYLFHMPAFFFLSGIFATKAAQSTCQDFLIQKLRSIAYPYVIWTAIIVISQFAMARMVNNPPDLHRALRFLIEPYGYGLWFLYGLFIISLLYYGLLRLQISAGVILMLAVTLSVSASFNLFSFWTILNTSMSFFIFYAVAAHGQKIFLSWFSTGAWLLPAISGICLWLVMTLIHWAGFTPGCFVNLLLAGIGVAGVVCLAKGLAQTVAGRFFSFLGVFSLEIYLGHPLWGTISRALLLKSNIYSPTLLVLSGVGLGIAGSVFIGVLCRDWKFPYLFRLPAKPRVQH